MPGPPRRPPARPAPALPEPLEVLAVAAPGLAPLVALELRSRGLVPVAVDDAGVTLRTDVRGLATLLLWSRAASGALVRLAVRDDVRHFDALVRLARTVPWAALLVPGDAVRLAVTCRKSRLYHSTAVAERVGGAIVAAVPGVTPTVVAGDDEEEGAAPQRVVVRLDRDRCTISIDAAGERLHRRGWRQATAKAPLRETLAWALLAASGWRPEADTLVDPCCGSGTIVIEGACAAAGIPPGMQRRFAAERWPALGVAVGAALATERRAARAAGRALVPGRFVAADRDAGAIAAARANAERAGVAEAITFVQADAATVPLPPAPGWLVSNPPYGRRVDAGGSAPRDPDAGRRALYATLGRRAREGGLGLALLTDQPALARAAGLAGPPELVTSNGGLRVGVWRRGAS